MTLTYLLRSFKVPDWSYAHLVRQPQVRVDSWLETLSVPIQHYIFCAEAKISLVELSRTWQYRGRRPESICEMISYKSLDYCVPIDEEVLVNVCLHGLWITTTEAARWTNKSVRMSSRPNSTNCPSPIIRPPPRKRPFLQLLRRARSRHPILHRQ